MFDFTNYSDLDAFCMIDYIGFNGGGSDTSRVPHGEPYAAIGIKTLLDPFSNFPRLP